MYNDKITDKLATWYFSNPKISVKTALKKKKEKRERKKKWEKTNSFFIFN